MSSFSFSYAHKSTIVHDIYCPDDNIAKIQIKYWQDLINIGIDKTPKSRKSVLLDRGIALGQGVQHPNSNTMLCILHTFNANELKFIKRRILTWIKVQGPTGKKKKRRGGGGGKYVPPPREIHKKQPERCSQWHKSSAAHQEQFLPLGIGREGGILNWRRLSRNFHLKDGQIAPK